MFKGGELIKASIGGVILYGRIKDGVSVLTGNLLMAEVLYIESKHKSRYLGDLVGQTIPLTDQEATKITKKDEEILFTKLL